MEPGCRRGLAGGRRLLKPHILFGKALFDFPTNSSALLAAALSDRTDVPIGVLPLPRSRQVHTGLEDSFAHPVGRDKGKSEAHDCENTIIYHLVQHWPRAIHAVTQANQC